MPDHFSKGRRQRVIVGQMSKCILPLLHDVNLSVGCLGIMGGGKVVILSASDRKTSMEVPGNDPGTSRMLSERSTI